MDTNRHYALISALVLLFVGPRASAQWVTQHPPLDPGQTGLRVARDQAYWIRSGAPDNQFFNQYFGPFQVTGVGTKEIDFSDDLGQARLYVKNMTGEELTVTLRQASSESAPSGQPQVMNSLPLLVRGSIDTTNLTFSYTELNPSGSTSVVLKPKGEPGSEAEIVLGLNRGSMTGAAGSLYAGVLELTDSLMEEPFIIRKHQAFRPVSSARVFDPSIYIGGGGLQRSQFTNNRLIGSSVWNSQWKIVIPGKELLANPEEGTERFIRTVKDVKLHFVT